MFGGGKQKHKTSSQH